MKLGEIFLSLGLSLFKGNSGVHEIAGTERFFFSLSFFFSFFFFFVLFVK